MSRNLNYGIVEMKKNKGKSKDIKCLNKETKKKQKKESKNAIKELNYHQEWINNNINLNRDYYAKHWDNDYFLDKKQDYEVSTSNGIILNRAYFDNKLNDYFMENYHEEWGNININLNRAYDDEDNEDNEDNDYFMDQKQDNPYEVDNSNIKEDENIVNKSSDIENKSSEIEDKFSDLEDYEKTNEAIYDYVCGDDSQYDDIDEFLQPIVPKHIELQAKINILEEKLSLAQETIYQLLGGLFNHYTQGNMLNAYTEFLYTGNFDYDVELGENQYPTTRQGDENEKRIQQLEENMDILVKRLKKGKPLHRFYRKFQKK